jgi:hypothetical protein
MWVCPGARACTKHLLKVCQGCPAKPVPNCNYLRDNCALETDTYPHAGVSKVRFSRTAVLVSHSLGGGAEHAQSLFLRNPILGPDAVSNQTPRGSGRDVYTGRWCSSVSLVRQRHKGMACVMRLTRMAPVSPHAHRVRPSSQMHSIGVSCFPSDHAFQRCPPDDPSRIPGLIL